MTSIQLAAAVAFGWVVFAVGPAEAHEVTAKLAQPVKMTDEQSIAHAMKALFDKPGAPLKVGPVSVEGSFAVAGWIQNDRGGRALLKKERGHWSIQACGGDGLKQATTLAMSGLDQTSAVKLAQKIAASEKQMPSDQIKKFSMFEGVVKVEGAANVPHTAGHGHPAHSK